MLSISVPQDYPSKAIRSQETPIGPSQYHDRYQQLNLEHRGLRSVPLEMLQYRIVTLHLDHNALKSLPSPKQLPELQYLNVEHNHLVTIPNYRTLTHLSIAYNPLTTIPASVANSVTELDVSYTKLVFPQSLANCYQLLAEGCRWKEDTLRFSAIPKVMVLDCSDSNLVQISNSASMVCLEEITLTHNRLTRIPAFRSMMTLVARDNALRKIAPSPMLDYLDVSDNKLVSLPPLPSITVIIAHHNCLKQIASYPEATSLDVAENQIVSIADQPKLIELFAGGNQIHQIGKMPLATLLDLESNCLTQFQIERNTKHLNLSGNPLQRLVWPSKSRQGNPPGKSRQGDSSSLRSIQVPLRVYRSIYASRGSQIAQVLGHLDQTGMLRDTLPILIDAGYPDPEQVAHALVEYLYKSKLPFVGESILEEIPEHLRSIGSRLVAIYRQHLSVSISLALQKK